MFYFGCEDGIVNRRQRMIDRYAMGNVPWDDTLPPPEVMAVAAKLAPGRALDLGCGYGRSAIYLARQGWQVDGIDYVPQAVAGAAARAAVGGLSARTCFHQASVATLDFLQPAYDLALDVGCLHNLDKDERQSYADGLRRLLRAGGVYLLYVRLRQPGVVPENGPRGMLETAVRTRFADGFVLENVEHGVTQVEGQPVWDSAWFYFRRHAGMAAAS